MRNIFRVDAFIIDANGTYQGVEGYPKNYDSKNYQDDVDKAYKRADGDAMSVWASFCTQDTRMIQTVTLSDISGYQIYKKSMGCFPAVPEPNA
jgi:hypothetical protein